MFSSQIIKNVWPPHLFGQKKLKKKFDVKGKENKKEFERNGKKIGIDDDCFSASDFVGENF